MRNTTILQLHNFSCLTRVVYVYLVKRLEWQLISIEIWLNIDRSSTVMNEVNLF